MRGDLQARLDAFMAIEDEILDLTGAMRSFKIIIDTLSDSRVEREGGEKRLVILGDVDSAAYWSWGRLHAALNKAIEAWEVAASVPIGDEAPERRSG